MSGKVLVRLLEKTRTREHRVVVTAEENELFTRIGPGMRMGALMRRCRQPIAASGELADRRTMRVLRCPYGREPVAVA